MRMGQRSVAVVLGTRPEAIKLGGVIDLLGEAAWVIHTGQHYDATLRDKVHADVGLAPPHLSLAVGGASRGQQIGQATAALDTVFTERRPRVVVVQGDTNATAAAALAANATGVALVHVEAGLRSHDRAMPEEHNRVMVDHLADLCCAPTATAADNLRGEGIPGARIAVTGNTVVEAVHRMLPSVASRAVVAADLLGPRAHEPYVVATFHRPENVDDPAALAAVLDGLALVPHPVVWPLHPRARARVAEFGLADRLAATGAVVTDPLGPAQFLGLAADALAWVTDSGGLQEEASVLKRPVVVVRRSTERPEVLGTFARLSGPGAEMAAALADLTTDAHRTLLAGTTGPYGDGTASQQVVDLVARLVDGDPGH